MKQNLFRSLVIHRNINKFITKHIFRSLQINISQEEYFTKYAEYLSRINHRERILSKYYGDDVTDFVQSDDGDIVKKIFAFKHSSE